MPPSSDSPSYSYPHQFYAAIQDRYVSNRSKAHTRPALAEDVHSHIAAITALIYEGIRTRTDIVRIMKMLDFNHRHVAITLERNTGRDPVGNHWWADADGRLHAHG